MEGQAGRFSTAMKSKPKVVSLFTGCGGSDSGLTALGFEVVFANDIMPYARDLYLANFPETDYCPDDVRTVTSFPAAELLVGCYPCQGFSQAGARVANRNINYLYQEFDRALREIRPKAFIVENVSGMCRSDSARAFEQSTCSISFSRIFCQSPVAERRRLRSRSGPPPHFHCRNSL